MVQQLNPLIIYWHFPVLYLYLKGTMKRATIRLFALPFLLLILSCNSPILLWSKKTAHEEYADKIAKTAEGKEWVAVSRQILRTPVDISLPYSHAGFFPADKPRALSLEFNAKRGEKIFVSLDKQHESSWALYADLFKKAGTDISHLLSADTAQAELSFDADETGSYVLRLQPELFRNIDYALSISVVPSLGFPVAGAKAKAGSFWGADRDGGKRNHEGVDIFAPKRTPVIAAEDGYVTKVGRGGLGGKMVWMKAADKGLYLYYAHLDKQLVETGQRVKKGDTLGLVGNTGNARTTPPHLHFGIYSSSGPIDPWPFINKEIMQPPKVPSKDLTVNLKLKNERTGKVTLASTTKADELVPLAVTGENYIAQQNDGTMVTLPFDMVTSAQ